MRITDNFTAQRAITNLGSLREAIAKAQQQATTGRRFETPSEDPRANDAVMRNTSGQRAITQYRATVGTARRRLEIEDTALQQLDNLLTRARELGVQQGDSTVTDVQRQSAAGAVNQLVAQAITLANSKDGDEYVFGGDQSTTAPFTLTSGQVYGFTSTGAAGTRRVEIGANDTFVAQHDGATVFGTTTAGILKTLTDLATALDSGSAPNVRAVLPSVDLAQQGLQVRVAETGARGNRLEMAESNLVAFSAQLSVNTSDVQEVDLETALASLVAKQTTYQAALSVTSRVLSMSLTDYLR